MKIFVVYDKGKRIRFALYILHNIIVAGRIAHKVAFLGIQFTKLVYPVSVESETLHHKKGNTLQLSLKLIVWDFVQSNRPIVLMTVIV